MSSSYKGIFTDYYIQGRKEQLIIDIKKYKEMLKEIGLDAVTIKKYVQNNFGEDVKELGVNDNEY